VKYMLTWDYTDCIDVNEVDAMSEVRSARVSDAELRKVGAQRRIAAFREQRVIVEATLAGRPQTAIAQLIGVSQPHVSRTIAAIKGLNNGQLQVLPESALIIIDRRDAGEIDTPTMMQALLDLDYTDGYVPDINGVPTDAYERGSWDDIEYAFQQDKLTFEEYSQLFAAHHAHQETAATHQMP
jgi:hypothetical protein